MTRWDAPLFAELHPVIRAYSSRIVRWYCRARFTIIRLRFIDELDQYLPKAGRILDVGCGFGLFGLTFARRQPTRELRGYDLNAGRVALANDAAKKLGMSNATFAVGDARSISLSEQYDAAYMMDIVHHIPPGTVPGLLTSLYQHITPGGVLLIKDVNHFPFWKRWFTWWLDKLMDPKTPVHYWPVDDLRGLLVQTGFTVHVHQMLDILPYPHVLYICRR
jgi:2-polyprenyl-3-methyl-5-hydroxy-6-metoxy-1,4-benzoquinol methylase